MHMLRRIERHRVRLASRSIDLAPEGAAFLEAQVIHDLATGSCRGVGSKQRKPLSMCAVGELCAEGRLDLFCNHARSGESPFWTRPFMREAPLGIRSALCLAVHPIKGAWLL